MKSFLLYVLLGFFVVGCNAKKEMIEENRVPLKAELLFKSKIGSETLKTEVLIFDLRSDTDTIKKNLFVELRKSDNIVFSDTLSIGMTEEPLIDIRDVDGDGTDDLLIEYLRPGRGSNQVSMLFLFDDKELKLKRIPNSIFFSNLTYDENLRYISSFGFYGGDGVQMNFLKIESDTLSAKYTITKEGNKVTVYKVDNGSSIKTMEKEIDSDVIVPEIIALEPEIEIQ